MAGEIKQNERTAMAQTVTKQSDGPGRRIGKRGEVIMYGKLVPGGAKLFRERLPQFQAEAAYWEGRIGTVHGALACLVDNDTRLLFMIMFDGDFKPYIADVIAQAAPWFDGLFSGVLEGYTNAHDPKSADAVAGFAVTSEFFYVAHPDLSVRDITKMQKLSKAVGDMLDAAS